MSLVTTLTADLKKTATGTGDVLVGLTDLAVEKVREAGAQAVATRKALAQIDPKGVQKELTAQAEKALKQAQEAPAVARKRGQALLATVQDAVTTQVGQVGHTVAAPVGSLSARGDALVTRLRTQQATKDLVAQVDSTIAVGKGAVTTARKAVDATTASARATLTTGRTEAVKTVDAVVDTVSDDVEALAPVVEASVKRTRTAAKKTTTTARKGAVRTTSRAKATSTSAKKTTATARKATKAAAKKVGD